MSRTKQRSNPTENLRSLFQKEITNKETHTSAEEAVKKYANNYAALLLWQAQLISHRDRAQLILGSHVDEATELLRNKQSFSFWKEISVIFGGALLGLGAEGLPRELFFEAVIAPTRVAFFIVCTVIGITLILLRFIFR